MENLRIVTLMEDNLCGDNLIAEHGLSLYIETAKHKLLVDTGQSNKTWDNANVRGIDLSKVDTVILSHGHYDHSGGLMEFASKNTNADIYLRSNADGEYYSYKNGGEQYIGIDKRIMKLPKVHCISENEIIDDELSVFTNVKSRRPIPKGNQRLHELIDGEYIQDAFSHEQYLVIKYTENEYALISGCAHKGILNILDEFREIYNVNPSIVVSGFHMIQSEYSEEDISEIKAVARKLSSMDTVFYTGHCTGDFAFNILKEIMGNQLRAMWEI